MTSLKHLPTFGPGLANCARCELKYQCEAKKHVTAHVPENWNGIVIVGEGPGVVEVSRQRPFCGPAGNMLKALLENVGVELDDCYVTNATLCVDGRTCVRMADGSLRRIDQIVKERSVDPVLSWDSEQNALVPRAVTGWYRNKLNGRRLFSVSYASARSSVHGAARAIVTEDHPIATARGFVRADQLAANDLVVTDTVQPQGRALDIVLGSLLGDGMIVRSNFRESHCEAQFDYAAEKRRALAPFVSRTWMEPARGGATAKVTFETKAAPYWRAVRDTFYKGGRKRRVPRDLIAAAGDQAFAVWYLDDGTLHPKKLSMISCCSTSRADAEWLAAECTRRGWEARVSAPSSKYQRIRFTRAGTAALSAMAAQFTPPSMQYKLLERDRGQYVASNYDAEQPVPFLDRAVVVDVTAGKHAETVYCLTVDGTHNFATSAVVVKNCLPPRDSGDGAFMERFPSAVHACLPRLRAELDAIKPRVVLALGAAAFSAMAGKESHRVRRVPTNCTRCDPKDRKIGPGLECAVAECDWFEPCAVEDGAELKKAHNNTCPKCKASIKRIKPKRVKCPDCGGLKTKEEPYTTFASDWKLSEVAGGLFPAETLPSGLEGIVKYVIPTYHPSFLLRSTDSQSGSKKFGGQFAARAVTDHFRRARELVDRDHVFEVACEITDDPERVREYTSGAGPFVVDIETDSEDGPYAVGCIRCVGIWDVNAATQLVVDTSFCTKFVGEEGCDNPVDPLVGALASFLNDETKKKIGQHFLYDRVTMNLFWGIETRGQIADTENAHQCLYPDEPHNLAHIAACMTDAEAWKPPKKKGGTLVFESFEELAVYNARDLKVTGDASFKMGADPRAPRGLLDQEGVRAPYEQDMALFDAAEEMELVGLPVDPVALKALGDAARTEISAALTRLGDGFVRGGVAEKCEIHPTGLPDEQAANAEALEEDPDADVKSRAAIVLRNDDRGYEPYVWRPTVPKDLLWALFDKPGFLELPVLMRTEKTKQPATSKEALLTHIGEQTGFVQALIDYRKHQKILSTYVEGNGLELKADGRIHAAWNVARAVTGRFTTSPNLQNWPRELRAAIVAPPGRKLVGADYAQLELRIMAALTGDEDLIRRCLEADENRKLEPDHDPHSYVADLTFGASYVQLDLNDPTHKKTKPGEPKCKCETCKRKALREVVKRTVYGFGYGASPPTVRDAIYNGGYEGPPITVAIIERVQQRFFAAFPKVNIWRNEQMRLAEETWEVRSPILRRRRVFPLGQSEFTIIVNYPMQAGGADIVNQGTLRYYRKLREIDPTARLIAQVHDALYTECDETKADAVAAWKAESLSCHLSLVDGAPPMAFLASAKVGNSWKEVS